MHDSTRGNDYIQTLNGSFWPRDPRPEDVDIETIAHALSNLCRFGGHCLQFYSVAQHSVECAQIAIDNGYSVEICLQTLLHDASEAYLVDVPRPLKKMLPEYMPLEYEIQKVIFEKFKLPTEMFSQVKDIDNQMLVTEASQLLNETNGWWREPHWPKPYDVMLTPLSPKESRQKFIELFKKLTK